jgi:prepilin-type N-terminal cleavage/methylation domain-containing protein
MKNKNKNKNKGFTLIELLVVIAIIGLLSSIVLASLSSARAGARDAKRMVEMKNVASALQLYSLSNNGNIPMSAYTAMASIPMSGGKINCDTVWSSAGGTKDLYETLIAAKVLSSMPSRDMAMESRGYCYVYVTDSVSVAGAMYDQSDTKHNKLLAAVISTKSRSGIFATPLETKKTSGGYNAFAGVNHGNSSFVLNIDLTSGVNNGSGSYGGSGSN